MRVDRRGPGFTRLTVTVADGRAVVAEVAQDARIRDAVQLSFGRVLHPDEVPADKTLALFGRAAARDLVDVAALSERYTLEKLCALAAEKDPGFDRRVLADALAAAAAHSDAAFAELGLAPDSVAALRARATRWRDHLLDAAGTSVTAALQSFDVPTPRPETPDSPRSSRPSEHRWPPPSNAGRKGPSLSP